MVDKQDDLGDSEKPSSKREWVVSERDQRRYEAALKRNKARIICPSCEERVYALRAGKGRILVTTTSGLVVAGAGALVGSAVGIVGMGVGIAGTIPFAVVGAVLGAGVGYVVSDKTMDKLECPKCKGQIKL